MKTMNPLANEKGFVLLVVYMIAIFVSIFSIAFFARHQAAMQATERYQNRVLAFNAAEAGIDFALREIATDKARETGTATSAYTSPVIPLTQNAFSYAISPVTGQPSMRRIDSTGYAPDCVTGSRAQQSTAITVYAQITTPPPPGSLFEYGIYATTSIDLSGSTFDSYNSGQGAYGGSNISHAGAIAGDATNIGAIELSGSTVKGSVLVNESGMPNTVITQTNSTITGIKGNLPAGWKLPAPPSIASLTTPPTEIDLSNVTSARTLSAGTYHCTQINISGNKGAIVTTGPVKIYVDGGVDITGQGTTVPNNQPGNLHIYVTGTASVKLRGNSSFFGGLYAPRSDVTFQTSNSGKGGNIFGAVVAKTFSTFGGGAPTVHFDLAMRENQVPDPNQTNIVRITAWQEMNSLAWNTGT